MKKIAYYIIIVVISAFGFISCQKNILQAPDTTGLVNLDKIYSSTTNALQVIASCYRSTLAAGWNSSLSTEGQIGWFHGTVSSVSGELGRGQAWHGCYAFATSGPSAQPNVANVALTNAADLGLSVSNFSLLYPGIRANFLLKENIDKVPDMEAINKVYVKAEAMGLNAYWYLQLFKNYGGMPIVKNSLLPTEDLNIPRATLQASLDNILLLCDSAIAVLPDTWETKYTGRLTKGAVMAMKAQALMFAARPLFNSTTPYLSLGTDNNLICFGTVDASRWNAAITASETALAWATANGKVLINSGGGINVANPNAFVDYATATSAPNNSEIILALHKDESGTSNSLQPNYNTSLYSGGSGRYNNLSWGLMRKFLTNYYKADGTEQSWPKAGDAAPRPALDYITRFGQMEPRFKADFCGPGVDAANNVGDNSWSAKGWGASMGNVTGASFPNGNSAGYRGTALQTKFYYKAGSRTWFEPPLFRVAELYLNLAEAYNEVGNSAKALANLNMVHNRAGLPSIIETDQIKLRAIIQREWAVEFFEENKRYYDERHWKLDLGTVAYGPQEEFQFQVTSTASSTVNLPTNLITYWSFVSFNAYWNPKMYLEPIPQVEINKGVIKQNPGY